MHERPHPSRNPPAYVPGQTPPCNFQDFGHAMLRGAEFDDVWGAFLNQFARYRSASFFGYPPPDWIEPEYQALLAGTAECLTIEFDLPMPGWVDDPKYILPELWLPWAWMVPADEESVQRLIAKAHPSYINRNVIFEARNLIVI